MSQLLVYPFIAEFGWHLMMYQGHCRYCSNKFDRTIVFCLKEMEYLYQDFATEIHIVSVHGGTPDLWSRGGEYKVTGGELLAKYQAESDATVKPTKSEMMNPNIGHHYMPLNKLYGLRAQDGYDLLIHARADKKKTIYGDRNWPVNKWEKLVKHLATNSGGHIRMASIGSLGGADHIEGTGDLRGVPIEKLCMHINYAMLTIGPSSGPIHLASLCQCPHVVWTDKRIWNLGMGRSGTNRKRYTKVWNPFKTYVSVIDHEGWQPKFKTVFDEVTHQLNRLTNDGSNERKKTS